MKRRVYRGQISSIGQKQILVVGTNPEGRHGKGAAKLAHEIAGLTYGKAVGLINNSYGIITKDLRIKSHPSVGVEYITHQIGEMYQKANSMSDFEFLVLYSGNPKSKPLNGYSTKEMADMYYYGAYLLNIEIPRNVIFEVEFHKLVFLNR